MSVTLKNLTEIQGQFYWNLVTVVNKKIKNEQTSFRYLFFGLREFRESLHLKMTLLVQWQR